MSLPIPTWLQPYVQVAFQIMSTIGIIGTFIGIIWQVVNWYKRRPPRSLVSRLILADGLVATAAVVSGILLGILPIFAILPNNVNIGNGVAIGGLVISVPGWLASLYEATRTRHWLWFGGMLILGAAIYAGAIFYNDFTSYLAVGALPILYGFVDPQSVRRKAEVP